MKLLKIKARIRRKKVSRKRVKPDYVKENILSRDFTANSPNKKRLTDVTEFSITADNRKLYLSPIMDLYDNSIITYELSFRNNNNLVFKMFDKATEIYPDAKPIFHSDRGYQYTGNIFKSKIEESEMFHGKKFKFLEELAANIVDYIKFYNKKRFQKKSGCMAPIEYRNHTSRFA